MVLGNTLNILRPPEQATRPVQTKWNEDLVKNMHDVLGRLQQQVSAITSVSTATLTSYATKAALEAATVPIVVTSIQLTGYTTDGDGGGALYKRVGAAPAHNLKIQSADLAWWEMVPDSHGYINVKQAGAVGDNTTDDGQAFIDALNFASLNADANTESTVGVVVPPSNTPYYLGANTLELKRAVHLVGQGSGQVGSKPSKLRWDVNITGIIIHSTDTIGATTEALSGEGNLAASGAKIEALWLESDGGTIANITDSTKGHGIWLRSRAVLIDLVVKGFPGNGINIVASFGSTPDREGNANGWVVERARIQNCHLNGIFVDGDNTNTGIAITVDASSNGRWGIHDSGFLGNTYIGLHAATNGLATIGENGAGESSHVEFSGTLYAANAAASEADLVATTPGTDETVWFDLGSGSANTFVPAWLASQAEGTYFLGGPYHTDNANGRNVFVGCYTESGQGPVQLVKPTTVYGGLMGNPRGSFHGLIDTTLHGALEMRNHAQHTPPRELTLRFNNAANKLINFKVEGDVSTGLNLLAWDETEKQFMIGEHANSGSRRPIRITSDLTTRVYGRASAFSAGNVAFHQGIILGSSAGGARHMTNDTAAPTSGEHGQGEIVWNRSATAGGKIGFVCVSGGTPGNWKAFGVIDA